MEQDQKFSHISTILEKFALLDIILKTVHRNSFRNKENIKGKELPPVFSMAPPSSGPSQRFGHKSPVLPPISSRPGSPYDHSAYLDPLPLQSIAEATNQKRIRVYRSDDSEKREVTFAGTDSVQLVTIQPKTRPGIQREHDDFTLACLAIKFTNTGFKTEGTPLCSTPHPDFVERLLERSVLNGI